MNIEYQVGDANHCPAPIRGDTAVLVSFSADDPSCRQQVVIGPAVREYGCDVVSWHEPDEMGATVFDLGSAGPNGVSDADLARLGEAILKRLVR